MIKKLVLLTMLGAVLTMTTGAFAEDVFMTSRGKKYHKESCKHVQNKGKIKTLELEVADEKGYLPCKRCFKEEIEGDVEQEEVKTQK